MNDKLMLFFFNAPKRRIASQLSVLSVSIITQTSIMTSLGTNLMQVLDRMGESFFVGRQKRMFEELSLGEELSV